MSNVSKGHGFEREVKKLFTDAGWYCTRAAASQSPMDLIAYTSYQDVQRDESIVRIPNTIFSQAGYTQKQSKNEHIPLNTLFSKRDGVNIKHVYAQLIVDNYYAVILMQCKINRRRLKT